MIDREKLEQQLSELPLYIYTYIEGLPMLPG